MASVRNEVLYLLQNVPVSKRGGALLTRESTQTQAISNILTQVRLVVRFSRKMIQTASARERCCFENKVGGVSGSCNGNDQEL